MLALSSDKIYNKEIELKDSFVFNFLYILELIFSTTTPRSSVLTLPTPLTIPDPNYPINHNHSLPVPLVCQDIVMT